MSPASGTISILAILAVILLLIFFKVLGKSVKWIVKLLIHVVSGFVILFLVNVLGGIIGINLELSLINMLITGILGVPGVILLLIIKYII